MSSKDSLMAVKDAIGGGETFGGKVDVIVNHNGQVYVYERIYVRVSYNVGYMQMDVDVIWDDDSSQPNYRTLDLHAGYNSNFQDFRYSSGSLQWSDGLNDITIRFK